MAKIFYLVPPEDALGLLAVQLLIPELLQHPFQVFSFQKPWPLSQAGASRRDCSALVMTPRKTSPPLRINRFSCMGVHLPTSGRPCSVLALRLRGLADACMRMALSFCHSCIVLVCQLICRLLSVSHGLLKTMS